jgi:hypothetical protein
MSHALPVAYCSSADAVYSTCSGPVTDCGLRDTTVGTAGPFLAPAGTDADGGDGEHLCRLQDEEVVPLNRGGDAPNVSMAWLDKTSRALRAADQRFTARPVVGEYVTRYYIAAMSGQDAAPAQEG